MSKKPTEATWARAAEVVELLNFPIDIGPSTDASSHEIQCKIQKVRNITMEDAAKYYEPHVVSIGPIHKRKPHLQAMEKYKLTVARQWAARLFYGFDLPTIESIYAFIEDDLLEARKCYPESYSTTYNERDWCQMMFLDACFTIEFMVSEVEPSVPWLPGNTDPFMENNNRDLVRRDLLLLENQLPYKVVDIFAYWRLGRAKKHLIPQGFICNFIVRDSYLEISNPDLLLDYPDHLLDYLRTLCIDPTELIYEVDEGGEEKYLANPLLSVIELKKAEIYCSCIKDFLSAACFKSYVLSGELKLPQLKIDKWTKHVFLNLVAYEISGNKHETGISSYLNFMAMLINQAEDVKELRSKEILVLDNFNGDDQAVVDLFRGMTTHVLPNPRAFAHVRRKIFAYSTSRRQPLRVVFGEFKRKYFGTPWSFLVFLAVIFTVGMTIIQTILTAIQTYLAAHPPKK